MPIRGRFRRWFASSACLLPLGLLFSLGHPPAQAAEIAPDAASATAFSVVGPAQRSAWQQRLTLGAGDVLSFHLFGAPELSWTDVPVGPDGRISVGVTVSAAGP